MLHKNKAWFNCAEFLSCTITFGWLQVAETFLFCDVCAVTQASSDFSHLRQCKHLFCKGCWEHHFEHSIHQGLSTSKSF